MCVVLLVLSLAVVCILFVVFFFFFNDTATTEIYTLSLHDALPISAFQTVKHKHPVLHSRCNGLQHQNLRLCKEATILIANNWKKCLAKANMTQNQLADAAAINKAELSRVCAGAAVPAYDTLRACASTLGCEIEDIYD